MSHHTVMMTWSANMGRKKYNNNEERLAARREREREQRQRRRDDHVNKQPARPSAAHPSEGQVCDCPLASTPRATWFGEWHSRRHLSDGSVSTALYFIQCIRMCYVLNIGVKFWRNTRDSRLFEPMRTHYLYSEPCIRIVTARCTSHAATLPQYHPSPVFADVGEVYP